MTPTQNRTHAGPRSETTPGRTTEDLSCPSTRDPDPARAWQGAWVALATPFREDGGLDLEAQRRLVRRCLSGGGTGAGGLTGLVVLGSTGEAATLDDDERDRVITACLEEARALDPTVAMVVGTGANSTRRTTALTRRAAELGADGALVVTPYYNKPNADGLEAHYRAVAETVPGLPIMAYNVPGRTGSNMGPALLERLWQIPSVKALKESSGDLAQIDALVRAMPEDRLLLSGDDPYALPAMALGARGLVSVMGNLRPAETAALVESALADRFDEARRLHADLVPLMEALFVETNPVPLKAGLARIGLAGDTVRAPLARASAQTRLRISAVLAELEGVAA